MLKTFKKLGIKANYLKILKPYMKSTQWTSYVMVQDMSFSLTSEQDKDVHFCHFYSAQCHRAIRQEE